MVQRTSWGVFRYVDFKVRKPTGRLVWQSLRCRHCWLVWELRRKVLTQVTTRMTLEHAVLTERSQRRPHTM